MPTPLSAPELKYAPLALARVDAAGTFAGYASLFDREDLGRDIVLRGAFRDSLAQRGAAGIRMLFQHDPSQPVGVWQTIREDALGLYVEGRLALDVARAREVHALMRAGALDGLSIGFRTVTGRRDARTGVRRLAKVDLWEISIVTFPLLPGARIAHVKSRRPSLAATIAAATNLLRRSTWRPPTPRGRGGAGAQLPWAAPTRKYRPDQPRVPAGQPDGGEWVDEGGTGAQISAGRTPIAQADHLSGYPVDLREEEQRGGHTIEKHVNVRYERLAERVQREADAAVERGHQFRGLSIGSFTSLDAATKLVNSTLSDNAGRVSAVARGERAFVVVEKHFEAPTGYEAYLDRRHAQPYQRDTYGVRIFILRDTGSKRGYNVRLAFPIR